MMAVRKLIGVNKDEKSMTDVVNEPRLVISSDEDAIELMKNALAGEYDDTVFQLEFDNWPILDVRIKGDRYHHSLPTSAMVSFIELQDSLNRVYADLVYNGDLRSLSCEDKELIELVFIIEEGSTKIKANFTGFLNKLGDAVQDTNNFRSAVILVAGLGVAGMGALLADSYFDNQMTVDLAQIKQKADASGDAAETERLKVTVKALSESHKLLASVVSVHDAKKAIVASAPDAEEVTLGEKVFDTAQIKALTQSTRTQTSVINSNDAFIIDGIKGYSVDGGKNTLVMLKNLNTGELFSANFDKTNTDNFSFIDVDRMFKAFREGKPINLSVNRRTKPNGDVTKSTIVSIKTMVEPEEES